MPVVLLLIGIILSGLLFMLNGWVFISLWNWFIVPLFNLTTLTLPQALGLMIVVGFVTKEFTISTEEEETDVEDTIKKTLVLFIRPLVILILGFLIQKFL